MVATIESPATTITPTAQSRFVWYDLMSTDRDTSLAFFTALLGWQTSVFDMGEMGTYITLKAGDASFGGSMRLDPADGHPSHFIGYVQCDDVDGIAARVPELGGSVPCPPMDIPDVGRFAVLQDSVGAYFSAITMLPGVPQAPGTDVPFGAVSWNEVSSDDPQRTGEFYAQLFGWRRKESWVAQMPDYTILMDGEEMVGGVMKSAHEGMPSAWLFYFNVEDIDEGAARVTGLGGSLVTEIIPVPSVGRIVVAVDPTGAVFALMQDES